MSALALTDTSNLYGAVAFYKACKDAQIRPILGAELHVQPEGVNYLDPAGVAGGFQVIALVENDAGYKSLCKLVTAGIFDGMHYKPRVDFELLRAHSDGLILLTCGVKGPIGKASSDEVARGWFDALAAIFDRDHLYLELQDLGLPGQESANERVRQLSDKTGYHTVATNAVHYLEREDSAVHEVLNAIATAHSMSDPDRLLCPTDQAWLKSAEEMAEIFPDDVEALARTAEIAQRCEYHFSFDTYHFPATTPPDLNEDGTQADTDANWAYFYEAFPPPADFGLPDPSVAIPPRPVGAGHINGYFAWYARCGLDLRLVHVDEARHVEYRERLEVELDIVVGMGFPAYLLIVAEFINWSKDNAIPVGPGRGSAAGSLAAWAMRITDIDPLRYGLLFERFLNPERVSMPDIDVDFCQDRREEAIDHVRKKYGSPLVSQIITYGTLKAKAAVRDVARVLDLSFPEADRIAKLIPDELGITLAEALDKEQKLVSLKQGDPKVRRVLDLAQRVEGACRQTGVHAAGVVIADRPLVEYAPLYRDEPEGGPVVQYDMKSAESIGLIKFDFLGLKTLDQIRDAVAMVEANHGIQIDMAHIPEADEATFELLHKGDALGVFQLESSGMRELLTRLQPSSMDDMVALVALYRPGPLTSGMTDDFVERKHGRKKVEYPHPSLEALLESTYGTVIYQEQVMQMAQVMAGYSLGEADLLRRAMGKKKKEEMDKQKSRFVDGSVSNGIDAEVATEIFDMMAKFAAYGFNKSHSAAYGYISYQTAWLKTHYRPEYMAALMTIEAANTDKVLAYILDCRRANMTVLPVCINESQREFSVPKPAERPVDEQGEQLEVVRYGMAAVRNVGGSAIEAIIEAREAAGGRFDDPFSFFAEVDYRRVNRRVIEHLIKAGALDFGGVPRSALMSGLEAAMTLGQRQQQDKAAGQGSLFSVMAPKSRPADFRFPSEPEWPLSQRLAHEKEVLGLYLSGHPMQAHARDVERHASSSVSQIDTLQGRDVEEVRVIGLVVEHRTIRTKRGDKMAFVRIEDEHSAVECTFFSDAWARSQRAIESDEPVFITGRLETNKGDLKILASSAERLSELRMRTTREVRFSLNLTELRGERLDRFTDILRAQRGGCRTRLLLTKAPLQVELKLPDLSVEPSALMEETVAALFGRSDVVELV